MPQVITCRDCGEPRSTIYRNTKYCMSCRVLRDFDFLEPVTAQCRSNDCTTAFLPVSKKDLYCGPCAGIMASEHGDCRLCMKVDRPLHRGLPACTHCLRDPGLRPRVVKALRGGQKTRRAANHKARLAQLARDAQDTRDANLSPVMF